MRHATDKKIEEICANTYVRGWSDALLMAIELLKANNKEVALEALNKRLELDSGRDV